MLTILPKQLRPLTLAPVERGGVNLVACESGVWEKPLDLQPQGYVLCRTLLVRPVFQPQDR